MNETIERKYFLYSMIFCMLFTVGNILLLLPYMEARADCVNECNQQLQKLYDSCVVNVPGYKMEHPEPPKYGFENVSYVYVPIEELVEDGN